jgi:hypothetical protein
MKEKVNHHCSHAIIQNSGCSEFMFQEYDSTYPRIPFRGQLHVIGGNYSKGDKSPKHLFDREIREEFSSSQEYFEEKIEENVRSVVGDGPGAIKQEVFAPKEYIDNVKNKVLEAKPWKDFVFYVPELAGKEPFQAIASVYLTTLDSKLFDEGREHLSSGRAIRNEGLTKIVGIDELLNGDVGMAWFTGPVMELFLGKKLPIQHGIGIKDIGTPKDSWDSYKERFDYNINLT